MYLKRCRINALYVLHFISYSKKDIILFEAVASATALFGKNVQLGCLIRDFSPKILKVSSKNFPHNIYTCLQGFNALTMTIKSAANKIYVVVG